jgi:hypothetical protein
MTDRDPDEVLGKYKFTHLQCRVDRHRWSRKAFYNDEARDFVPGFTRRWQTCQDCGMQRWKEIDIKSFEYTGRYGYLEPKGYYTPGTGLTLADFSERLLREDYAAAEKSGRVMHAEPVPEDDAVTPIKAKAAKAS